MGRDGGNKGGRPGEERGELYTRGRKEEKGVRRGIKGEGRSNKGREECSCQQPSMMM